MLHSFRKYLGASTANARRGPTENDQIDYFIVSTRLRVVKATSENLLGYFSGKTDQSGRITAGNPDADR
jgi:hypothetical protein